MTQAEMIQADQVAAAQIDPEILAICAVANQVAEMAEATDSFAAYWAGSASASVMHHYHAGAVVTVGAR
jgi:hypothetical protein